MKISPSILAQIAASAGIAASASADQVAGQPCKNPPPPTLQNSNGVTKDGPADGPNEIFAKFDTDKDGSLSAEEFQKAYTAIVNAPRITVKPINPRQHTDKDPCLGCGLG